MIDNSLANEDSGCSHADEYDKQWYKVLDEAVKTKLSTTMRLHEQADNDQGNIFAQTGDLNLLHAAGNPKFRPLSQFTSCGPYCGVRIVLR